jgi:allantoicase
MACGYKKGVEIPGLRLFFPAFAAGAMGSSAAFFDFLVHLSEAYNNIDGSGPISHNTAVLMLHGRDQGSMKFMGTKMGMGVFIAEAGDNKMMVHQGANDGFRALYLYCFSGPNRDQGFVIQSNADNESVLLISELAQIILTNLDFKGVNLLGFQNKFNYEDLRQEEIVNLSYKKLIFDLFKKNLPELPKGKRVKGTLSDANILRKAKLVEVSNEMFAQASNLQNPYLPIFDPAEFGSQGKVMDSWETSRHNENEFDFAIFELANPEIIKYVIFCTKFHLGNHFEQASVEISEYVNGPWVSLMKPIKLEGHSKKAVDISVNSTAAKFVRIVAYPDGGLSRVYLLNSIPGNIDLKFDSNNKPYMSPIPGVLKSLSLPVEVVLEDSDLAKNGKIEFVSNQHYGDASYILSAFEPLNMFDGFESARSRGKDHEEEIIIKLGRAGIIDQIIFDFNYFKNNNPNELTIFAYSEGNWVEIIPRNNVKAFAGNKKLYKVKSSVVTEKIKVNIFPDGGFNRIRVLERH